MNEEGGKGVTGEGQGTGEGKMSTNPGEAQAEQRSGH